MVGFEPAAWLHHPEVRMLRRAARSLFFDLVCIENVRGRLPGDLGALAKLTGETKQHFERSWASFAHLFKRRADGTLVSRRPILNQLVTYSQPTGDQLVTESQPVGYESVIELEPTAAKEDEKSALTDENMAPSTAVTASASNEILTHSKRLLSTKNEKNEKKREEAIAQPAVERASPSQTWSRKAAKVPSSFDLEAIYAVYRRKRGRKKGLETAARVIKTQEDYDAVMAAAKNYVFLNRNQPLEFHMHFSRFMNEWEDYRVDGNEPISASSTSSDGLNGAAFTGEVSGWNLGGPDA